MRKLRVPNDRPASVVSAYFTAVLRLAPGIRCWELDGDGNWTRIGDVDYQAARLRRIGESAE